MNSWSDGPGQGVEVDATATGMPLTEVDWPVWDIDDPAQLARYVLPDLVARYARIPGVSGDSRRSRLAAVWQRLRDKQMGYVFEPAAPLDAGNKGRVPGQHLRPPGEVLETPGSGTCIDLALVLAAACVKAGLQTAVILLDPLGRSSARHAVVAVLLGEEWPSAAPETDIWPVPAADFTAAVRAELDGPPSPVVVLDPAGLAVSLGTSRSVGTDVPLPDAVKAGYEYLTNGDWVWRAGVLVGRHPRPFVPAPVPAVLPLREELHRRPESAESVLKLLRPEFEVTPFQARK